MSDWVHIQENVFTRWVNDRLAVRGSHVENLKKGFKNGVALIVLVESLTEKTIKRYNKRPMIDIQKMENITLALNLVSMSGVRLVNVGTKDIFDGNMRIILGLVWRLILRFQMAAPALADKPEQGQEAEETKSAPVDNSLLEWVRSKIPHKDIKNFTSNWTDGTAVCALVHALCPALCTDAAQQDPANALANATSGINTACDSLGVEKLMLPEEMVNPKVDKLAVMTYISQFMHIDPARLGELNKPVSVASQLQAYGDGLNDGVAKETLHFVVKHPDGIQVEGLTLSVSSGAAVAQEYKDGEYACSYPAPDEEGTVNISITVENEHVPGSPFMAVITAAPALGGEGKVRVFYTTVTASRKVRSDIDRLEQLFTIKKVHLLPDFEPWVPVDMMDREDREAVFALAGSRKLPLVFVDDVFIDGYDELEELNEIGEFDKTFGLNHLTLLTPAEHLTRMGLWAQQDDGKFAHQGRRTHYCGQCGNPRLKNNSYCPDCGASDPIEITADTADQIKWFTSAKAVGTQRVDIGGNGGLVESMRNKLNNPFTLDDDEEEVSVGGGMDDATRKKLLNRFSDKEAIRAEDLIMATYYGDGDLLRAIIRSGFDVNAANEDGQRAIDMAMKEGQYEIVKMLKKAGATIELDNDAFFVNVAEGELDFVKCYVYAGMSVDATDSEGTTALQVSIEEEQWTVQAFLQEEGATQLTEEDFFVAVSEGKLPLVEYFVAQGFDVNLADEQGTRILVIAKEEGFTDVVTFLEQHGATESAPVVVEEKKVHCLQCDKVFEGSDAFCDECGFPRHPTKAQERKLFMEKFAEQEEIRDAFFNFVRTGNVTGVQNLLKQGMRVNAVDDLGNNAYSLAREGNHTELLDFLESKGATEPEICHKCKKNALGVMLEAEGNKFHKKCFVCCAEGCGISLVNQTFIAHETLPYCPQHYGEIHAPHCGHCNEAITSGGYMEALGKPWHDDCFVCTVCEAPFPDLTFVNYKNEPHCNACYVKKTAMECFACKGPITGAFRDAENHRWHETCFVCVDGKHALDESKGYHYHTEKIYCPAHFKELFIVRCAKCNEEVKGEISSSAGKSYHPACFEVVAAETKEKAMRQLPYSALRDGVYPSHLTVDESKKETYLSDEDFASVFSMSKQDFDKLLPWKQKRAKKQVGLL